MTQHNPKTSESDAGAKGADDVQSDPAKGSDDRSDWSDEGGATPGGPADTGDPSQSSAD